jgi:hypothetical protein
MASSSHASPLRWLLIISGGLLIGVLVSSTWQALGNGTSPPAQPSPPAVVTSNPAPASGPSSRPAASQPALAPAVDLSEQAAATAAALRKRLDGSFKIVVDPPFVVAGNITEPALRTYLARSIVRPARAMWASYFTRRPDRVITILLLADGDSYRAWAKRLFGDTDVSYFGYYRDVDRTLVMNIDTGTGTLVHELTHALIRYDWPRVPTWFDEGLASLHEQCSVKDTAITGLPNWRLGSLQNAIRAGRLRPLADLVAAGDFYGAHRGINYAHARYFCLYLQHRGLLKRFYRDYKAAFAAGTPATTVIETVCGKPIADVDREYRAWAITLSWDGHVRPLTRPSSRPSSP